jgi:hypothetical protein
MSASAPALTAMIASAVANACSSAHDETRYPPPSCSAFHGRAGSSECEEITCGMPCSLLASTPPMLAYQVCEWTRSRPAAASAISRSIPSVWTAAFAPRSPSGLVKAYTFDSSRGAPKQSTLTSISLRNS